MAGGDPVITFTSCWIAFNAFYAQDTADSTRPLNVASTEITSTRY